MRPVLAVFAIAPFLASSVFAGSVSAGGAIADACAARALGDASACACAQSLADDTVREGLRDLIADYLGRRVDVAEIAAERGHSGAEALYDAHSAYHDAVEAQCGLPKPQ